MFNNCLWGCFCSVPLCSALLIALALPVMFGSTSSAKCQHAPLMFTFKCVQQPMFNTTVSQVWQPHNHLPIRFELQKNQFDRKLVILVQILSEDISEVRDIQSCLLLFVHKCTYVHFCKTLHLNLNSWLYFGLIEVKLKLFSIIELFAITEPKSIEFIDHSVLQSEIPLPLTSPKQIEWTLF